MMLSPLRPALPLGAASLALLLSSLAAAAFTGPAAAVDLPIDARALKAGGVEFAAPERERGATDLSFPGSVVVPPGQLHVVAAPVTGLIEAVEVAPDELVAAGQPILRMRSPEHVAAQRDFISADTVANLARDRLRRAEALFAARALPERDLRTAETDAATTGFRAEEREHALRLMGMSEPEIDILRKTRDYAPTIAIVAPKPGFVVSRYTSPGTRVAAAEPLFTIARLDPLWVNIQVPSSRIDAIEVGAPVTLPAQGATGRVIRIGRSVDAATQSIAAVAEITDGVDRVRPGLAVTVNVRADNDGPPQWVVPSASVVRHRERSWIFVRAADGVRAMPVEVVAQNARDAAIRAELEPDDRIATRGLVALLAELARRDPE